MTNYEKIKAMSIDGTVTSCHTCPHRGTCSTCILNKWGKALKDWLKAESEED